MFYDPYQMAAVAQRLQAAGVPMREFPQTPANLTEIATNLYDLIKGRGLIAYPDKDVRLAISRAIAVETGRGWRITKEKQAHKIDVVVALAMAAHAAMQGSREHESNVFVSPIFAGSPSSVPGGMSFGADVVIAPTPASLTASALAAQPPEPPKPVLNAPVVAKPGHITEAQRQRVANDRSLDWKIMTEPGARWEPQPSLGNEPWRFRRSW